MRRPSRCRCCLARSARRSGSGPSSCLSAVCSPAAASSPGAARKSSPPSRELLRLQSVDELLAEFRHLGRDDELAIRLSPVALGVFLVITLGHVARSRIGKLSPDRSV